LPAVLPPKSFIVIQGDAAFTVARPLVGSGILVVFGDLDIAANSESNYNGVIYVTGSYTQGAPSLVHGTVIGQGNIRLVGGGDFAEVDWDAAIVQQVRNQLGGYRFSRSEYGFPDDNHDYGHGRDFRATSGARRRLVRARSGLLA
jgi:hypothetical protein